MLLAVAASAATAFADDILVPQDVPNLKDALLTAQNGDRVIVNGGVWRNGRVLSSVTMLGRFGATLTGLWEIQGAGATVEGFAVRDGSIEIAADDVTLRGNRFSAPKYTTMVLGDGVTDTTIENNRFTNATVGIDHSTGLVARGNRFSVGEIGVNGSDTLIEDNVFVRGAQCGVYYGANCAVRRNSRGSIYSWGVANVTVEGNTVRGGVISVDGNGALVADNELVSSDGLYVDGNDAIVHGNRITGERIHFSIDGDRAIVTDNVVVNLTTVATRPRPLLLMRIEGAGPASVLRNDVTHGEFAGVSIDCDDTEIASNTIRGGGRTVSLLVSGDRNNVHDNTIRRSGAAANGGIWGIGLRVDGTENVVADCSVTGAPYDGVSVTGAGNLLARLTVEDSGRCGITVDEAATSTGVADCIVDGARWSSLFVLGTGTTVTGGSYTNGRKVDVLDLGTDTEFVSATFATKSESEGLRPFR